MSQHAIASTARFVCGCLALLAGAPEGGEHAATPRPGWRTCMGHVPHPLVQQDQAAAAHRPPPAASPPPPTRPPHVAQFGISNAKERILFHDGLLCHEVSNKGVQCTPIHIQTHITHLCVCFSFFFSLCVRRSTCSRSLAGARGLKG